MFCHKHAHTHTHTHKHTHTLTNTHMHGLHNCLTHILSTANQTPPMPPTNRQTPSSLLQPPGAWILHPVPGPHPRAGSRHTGCPLSLSMRHHQSQAATGKRQHTTNTHTHWFLTHLQRMAVHDSGVVQRLHTWPSGMHHSISTVSSVTGSEAQA